MTIISLFKEYWPSWGSNHRPNVLKSCTLPIELRGSAKKRTRIRKRVLALKVLFSWSSNSASYRSICPQAKVLVGLVMGEMLHLKRPVQIPPESYLGIILIGTLFRNKIAIISVTVIGRLLFYPTWCVQGSVTLFLKDSQIVYQICLLWSFQQEPNMSFVVLNETKSWLFTWSVLHVLYRFNLIWL